MTHFVLVAVKSGRSCVLSTRYNVEFLPLLSCNLLINLILAQKSWIQGIISGHYNLRKLAITSEAQQLSYHAKVQLLVILIETLDLENLLQMVHDEIPYRYNLDFVYII